MPGRPSTGCSGRNSRRSSRVPPPQLRQDQVRRRTPKKHRGHPCISTPHGDGHPLKTSSQPYERKNPWQACFPPGLRLLQGGSGLLHFSPLRYILQACSLRHNNGNACQSGNIFSFFFCSSTTRASIATSTDAIRQFRRYHPGGPS